MGTATEIEPSGTRYVKSFLGAGTSALLILMAHIQPELRIVSLIALIPFLWRAIRASFAESVFLGATLAVSYCLITVAPASWGTPSSYLFRLFALILLFVLYSTIVNRMSKHIGLNAFLIAMLWLPIEYALDCLLQFGSVFGLSGADSTLSLRISSFFGLLMISFLIVLINSLLVIAADRFARASASSGAYPLRQKCQIVLNRTFEHIIFKRPWHYSSSPRSPPIRLIAR